MTLPQFPRFVLTALAVGLMASPAAAAQVQVKGLHLCCGSCVSAVEGSVGEVAGVSKLAVDRGGGSAEFTTTGPDVTAKALAALAKAGMYGTVTVDGKPAEFPAVKVKAGTQAEKVVFEDVHLCCRACSNGVVRALEKDDVIGIIDCDQKQSLVTITAKGGSQLDVAAVQAALNKAGFHAKLREGKADPAKK
jgi:copper chaperone CopZ